MWRAAFKQEPRPGARATAWPCLASLDLPTTLEPSSLTVGEPGHFKCLRDLPQAPCLRRPGLFSFGLHATGYNAIQLQSNASPLGAHASLSRIGSPAHPRNDCLSAAFLCPIPPPLHASRPAHLRSSF